MEFRQRFYQKTEYCIWIAGILCGLFGLFLFLLDALTPFSIEMLRYRCWIHEISGLYCPGCGGTRAFFYLFQGQFFKSLLFHPLVAYMGVLYLVFMVRGFLAVFTNGKYPFMKYRIGYIYIGIAVTLLQFLAKNISLLLFHLDWLG